MPPLDIVYIVLIGSNTDVGIGVTDLISAVSQVRYVGFTSTVISVKNNITVTNIQNSIELTNDISLRTFFPPFFMKFTI